MLRVAEDCTKDKKKCHRIWQNLPRRPQGGGRCIHKQARGHHKSITTKYTKNKHNVCEHKQDACRDPITSRCIGIKDIALGLVKTSIKTCMDWSLSHVHLSTRHICSRAKFAILFYFFKLQCIPHPRPHQRTFAMQNE